MKINTLDVSAARGGAAFSGIRSPWASLSAMGASLVLAPHPLSASVLPTAGDIRKQYVHKTRVNAGGDGASGPHPEREPA